MAQELGQVNGENNKNLGSISDPSITPKFSAKSAVYIPTPLAIKTHLDQTVISQDNAKRKLAIEVHNHYLRIAQKKSAPSPATATIGKSNILILGPTGSGKTLLASSIATFLSVPFAAVDATRMTEAGYIGGKVENAVGSLLTNANGDRKKAEMGIIYIDEIDKIAARDVGTSRDISGAGVQKGLLKIMEGTICEVRRGAPVDTTNVLFICGGAFVGLDEIIAERLGNTRGPIGFHTEEKPSLSKDALLSQVEPRDLERFGFTPEFIGRMPIRAPLQELTKQALVEILTKPKDALTKQYQALLEMNDTQLQFEAAAIEAIAEQAVSLKVGARGLRTILAKVIEDIQFDAPNIEGKKSVTLTAEMVKKGNSQGAFFNSLPPSANIAVQSLVI